MYRLLCYYIILYIILYICMYLLPYTTYIYIYIGFYGNIDHGPRKRLMDELIISLQKYNLTYIIQPSKLWKLNMYVYYSSYTNFICIPLILHIFYTLIFLLISALFPLILAQIQYITSPLADLAVHPLELQRLYN